MDSFLGDGDLLGSVGGLPMAALVALFEASSVAFLSRGIRFLFVTELSEDFTFRPDSAVVAALVVAERLGRPFSAIAISQAQAATAEGRHCSNSNTASRVCMF